MKKLLLFVLSTTCISLGIRGSAAYATSLNPGDVVITAVNADGGFSTGGCPNPSSTNNLFAFVNRVDIDSGTVIYFTDNAWSGSVWRAGEGTLVFTATNLITAGTTTVYNDCSLVSSPAMRSRSGGWDPATAGDNIIVYQGTGIAPASPNFIYAIGWASASPWISSGSPTANNSYIPIGLTSGTTAVTSTALRNGRYMCANSDLGSTGFFSTLGTITNWTGSSTTGFSAPLCAYVIPFDLSLTKSQTNTGGLSTGFVRVGQLIAYQLTLSSVFGLATDINVQDILPLGFTYMSHSATTGTYTTGSSLWNVASLASGASETLTITGTINTTGTILNTASLFSFSGTDQSGANNTDTVSITGVLTPPTAVNDSGTITEEGSGVIAVLQNDIAGSGVQVLSITGLTLPGSGTVSIEGTGILYTPLANFCGTDTFTYTVQNQFGEVSTVAATVTITITCINDLPLITLLGNDPEQVLRNTTYIDSGATASDIEDGDISTGIVVSGFVNTSVLGTYILTYSVMDSLSGLATPVTRTVHVVAGGLPIISLIGSGMISQPALVPYAESGAVYNDLEDGSGAVSNISGIVLTGVLGTYIVTYDYTDTQGNTATQVTRTVTITAPVCAPGNEGNVSTGNVASCVLCAPGSANATTGGSCLQCAPGTFAANAGSLTCDTCPIGLTSSTGSSSCVDTTPPIVTLQGSGTIVVLLNTSFIDPGATWVDVVDGSGNAVVSGTVNTMLTGSYILTYTYVDVAGNTGNTVSRTVIVTEGNMPIITLNDAAIITQDAFTPYTESGAVYSDVEDGTGMVVNISGAVHTGEVGTCTITYDYTDTQGNVAVQVMRIVHIVAPICAAGQELIMSGSVPSCNSCPVGSSNNTTGGSCVQCAAGTFANVMASLSCSPCPIGMTSITGASSCSDTIAPLVTLSGASTLSLLQGMPYVELGAMWVDGVDGSGNILMPFSGSVQTSVVGVYTLYYRYTDAAGNTGNIVTRQVAITAIPVEPTTTGSAGFGGGGGGSSAAAIAAAVAGATKPAIPATQGPTVPMNSPSDEITFNPTITGLCYERDDIIQLTGASTLAVHKDFPAALRFLASYELTKYNTINSYRPLDSLTREEAAKLFTQYARNVLCRQPNTKVIQYSDIASADQTLLPYLSLAYQLTLMHGDAKGTFRPKVAISKPEFLAVLVRTILYSYLDETSAQRYASYEQVGKDLAIITQDIDPLEKGISRHDAALMLFRAYRYQKYGVFDRGYETYILENYAGVVQKYQ